MTIDQIKYFVELGRYQHVGKAAKAAHISPSALSTAVTALERELGCQLFMREGRNIRIAEEGKRFMEASLQMLSQFDSLAQSIVSAKAGFRGNPRLGASHFLASRILAPVWSEIQNAHPELSGEIASSASASVLNQVVAGSLDLGLVFSPFRHPELNQHIHHQGQLVLAVRKNHPLLKSKVKLPLSELSKYPAVLHKGTPGIDLCETHPIFDRFGIEPKIVLAFDNDECAIQKLLLSDAWTMVPDLILKLESSRLSAIPLPAEWDAPYTIASITKRTRTPAPSTQELLTRLEKKFASVCARK